MPKTFTDVEANSEFLDFQESIGIDVRSCREGFAGTVLEQFEALEAKSQDDITEQEIQIFIRNLSFVPITNHEEPAATIENGVRTRYNKL